ncbi:uncharacterized protein [Dermacentor albipictus]|uniref:uncharacterized protein isoform X2 n=1 Tax=Dermacentor albipictus TaxID=60249 RepID=UPI0031FC63B9
MHGPSKTNDEPSTASARAETASTTAGSTKKHRKHRWRDGKRQRPPPGEEGGKSPDWAESETESSSRSRKRWRKKRDSRDYDSSREKPKTPKKVPASAAACPKPQDGAFATLPSSRTDQIPAVPAPQQAPAFDQPAPTHVQSLIQAKRPTWTEPPIRPELPIRAEPPFWAEPPLRAEPPFRAEPSISAEPPAQKNDAAVPDTEERKPDGTFLVSTVACVAVIVALVLALVGIFLRIRMPATEHGCPPPNKSLAEGNVMVETKGGRLVGSRVTVYGVAVARFLGIPFAQSTAGIRRFSLPLPLGTQNPCELREYLEPRPPCAQWSNGSVFGSEDCLHVNVWTPAAAIGGSGSSGGRALVVAVSGKWFETGSNDDPDWPMLAAKGDVVVVAPNHRQGVLGFLHPPSVAGLDKDVAVDDVASAVQWARDHAKAFGADPNQLVLVGRGTGSYLLSAAARNMDNNAVRRAFYHGPVYGSLLPFDTAVPYLSLALALHCSGTDQSAWVSCFRAAPVDKLLQVAHGSSHHWPLPFAPYVNVELLLATPVATPRTVVAGADAADDKALFAERILPLAQRDGNASTPEALVEFAFNTFNAPLVVKSSLKRRFKADSVEDVANGISMAISTCATLKVAKAVAEGYHYRLDSAVASGLLRPPLGIGQVAQFAAHGTVPPLADTSPWPPLGKLSKTRVVSADGHDNFTSYFAQCAL